MKNWNLTHIPDQKGKVIIITGATSGLGKEAARVLASKNAQVILAVRNISKGEQSITEIKREFPNANLDVIQLELDSLKSIHAFATNVKSSYNRLDVLINNAGVMLSPYSTTIDGFENQMGVNHLGHFALSGLLLPLLMETPGSRIVVTSSMAHKSGKINLADINWTNRKYRSMQAYADSKLANLYFAYELGRKLQNVNNTPMVVAAHPGHATTELQRHSLFWRFMNHVSGQKVEKGILPTLRAGFDETAKVGDYYGPSGFMEVKGEPVLVKSNALSHDQTIAKKLWEISEELTKVKFAI